MFYLSDCVVHVLPQKKTTMYTLNSPRIFFFQRLHFDAQTGAKPRALRASQNYFSCTAVHSAAKAKSITISCGVQGSGCLSAHLMYEQSEHLTLALSERRVFELRGNRKYLFRFKFQKILSLQKVYVCDRRWSIVHCL